MNSTKKLSFTAFGIALYVCLSMSLKIPVIGHIGLDLGYIVFAVYCARMGPYWGAAVGGIGCVLVSLLSSGWFPPGWLLGNIAIGLICGGYYKNRTVAEKIFVTSLSVLLGIAWIKTIVECGLYQIPFLVKFPKNFIAFFMDAAVMSFGVIINERIPPMKIN